MSRNLEASTCQMTEPFNFEKNEVKPPSHDSLRTTGGHQNHPNFRLKNPENENENNFLLCEKTRQYLASQEDNSLSSNTGGINGEVVGPKENRKTGECKPLAINVRGRALLLGIEPNAFVLSCVTCLFFIFFFLNLRRNRLLKSLNYLGWVLTCHPPASASRNKG